MGLLRSRKNLSQALTGIMGLRVNVQCNDIFQAEDLNSSPFSANLLFCLQIMAIASITLLMTKMQSLALELASPVPIIVAYCIYCQLSIA